MIREAFVLADAADAGRPVAGVPLLLRTVLVLQRAGIERCTVVGGAARPEDPRIRLALATTPALEPPADEAPRLVVGPGAVIDETLVRHLAARARPGEVFEVERHGARVRVAPGPLVAGNGGVPETPGAGTLEPVAGPARLQERALLRSLENPRDGYLDRLLYRRLSRPFTRAILGTRITPNVLTVMGITLGIAGGLALGLPGRGSVAIGIVLLLISGVLDCSDGELARLRFSESRLGHWLDVSGDTLVHLGVLGGVSTRLGRMGLMPGRPWLVLLVVGVLGAFAAITWSEQTEARRRRAATWENGLLDRVLSPLTTRDWHVFPVAFALAGRLEALVPAAAVGAHVFWATVVVLVARVLRKVG